jgi:O-antigen ligase
LISIIAFSGVILASIVLAISIDIIPSPGLVQNLDFTGRIHLWKATFYGYLDRPVFGWGAGNHAEAMNPYISREDLSGYGPHNSYARIFLELGFTGGVSYIYIIYRTIMIRVRTISSDLDIVELMILFTVIGIHFFEGYTILGLSLISSVSAIIIGCNKNIK